MPAIIRVVSDGFFRDVAKVDNWEKHKWLYRLVVLAIITFVLTFFVSPFIFGESCMATCVLTAVTTVIAVVMIILGGIATIRGD